MEDDNNTASKLIEIKEILDDLKDSSESKYINPFELTDDSCKILLDYITNLQHENEELKKQVSEYQDEIFARDNNWYDMQD